MGEIKLFGQKIVLQPKQESISEDDNKTIERERDDANDNDNDDDDENKTSNHHHKRPEKIIPCPRCKSMETKFCYFNNYNVNQPRHFCKGCQRYWTAGGALRNVPVGAGRRKSKPLGVGVGGGGGGVEYLENSYFDGLNMSMGNFDLNGVVVDEWRLTAGVAAGGGGFGIKRRKSESTG